MAKDPSKLTLSPTKVDTFYGCRRLFLYNYLRPPFPQKDNKYFAIGNIAHKALELFHSATSASHDKALMRVEFIFWVILGVFLGVPIIDRYFSWIFNFWVL